MVASPPLPSPRPRGRHPTWPSIGGSESRFRFWGFFVVMKGLKAHDFFDSGSRVILPGKKSRKLVPRYFRARGRMGFKALHKGDIPAQTRKLHNTVVAVCNMQHVAVVACLVKTKSPIIPRNPRHDWIVQGRRGSLPVDEDPGAARWDEVYQHREWSDA